jgi:hypothetical protein
MARDRNNNFSKDGHPVAPDLYDTMWGDIHPVDAVPCPPDNLYETYAQHGGDPTPKDNNANGSDR